jgi:hypothetical protein
MPSDSILDITFQNLIDNVVDGMEIVALVSALFSIFGFVLVIYPKWLQENCAALFYYDRIQIAVSMVMLSLGLDCQPRPRFSDILRFFWQGPHSIPYYKIMYYGSVGQATFRSSVVIASFVRFVVRDLRGG